MVPKGPKVDQNGPTTEPRSLQNGPQRALANITKHMVVIDRMALGAFPGSLGNSTFFQNTSRHLLLDNFFFGRHFGAPGLENGCQNGYLFCCKMEPFGKWVPKAAKVGPKGGPDTQNDPKMVPQGPKMGAPRSQKLTFLGLQSVDENKSCSSLVQFVALD